MIISWNTTNACNMFCDHCYRDAGCKADEELNTQEAKTLLEQIAKAVELNEEDVKAILNEKK